MKMHMIYIVTDDVFDHAQLDRATNIPGVRGFHRRTGEPPTPLPDAQAGSAFGHLGDYLAGLPSVWTACHLEELINDIALFRTERPRMLAIEGLKDLDRWHPTPTQVLKAAERVLLFSLDSDDGISAAGMLAVLRGQQQ